MRPTGVVRKLDELGRVVLPIEQRRELALDIKDPLEISVNENKIVLMKYIPKCVFCKGENDVVEKLGKLVCRNCIEGLNGTN